VLWPAIHSPRELSTIACLSATLANLSAATCPALLPRSRRKLYLVLKALDAEGVVPPTFVDEEGEPVEGDIEDKRMLPEDAVNSVEEDWVYDSAGTQHMRKDSFFKSWFEVRAARPCTHVLA
jgi:hypothetical protein